MLKHARRSLVGIVTAASLAIAVPAGAQLAIQDGLVNVAVGDVNVLNDARIALAAQVAAQICGLKVGPVAALGRAIDLSGGTRTVCQSDQGPVTIQQNN